MPRWFHAGLVGIILFLCSAAEARGQWVEPPGTGWLQVRVAHHDTQTRFDETATEVPLFNKDARSITTTFSVTGTVGLWQGLDTWIEVPFHHLRFNDVTRMRSTTGFGDPRIFLRVGPSLFGAVDLPFAVAVRGGVKAPLGKFAVDAEVIPLSEGQRDWELLLELGKSLHPWPIYAMGWIGYRWREPDPQTGVAPGDERVVHAAVGGSVDSFTWKVALDGLFGRPTTLYGTPLAATSRRELLQIIPAVGRRIGPGVLELGVRMPLYGRNLPAGPTFTLGYFLTWNDPLW